MKDIDQKGKVSADALLKKLQPYLEEKSIAQKIPETQEKPEKSDDSEPSGGNFLEEAGKETEEEQTELLEETEKEEFSSIYDISNEDSNYNLMSIFGVEDEEVPEKEDFVEVKKERSPITKDIDLSDKEQRDELKDEIVKRYAFGMLGLIATMVMLLFTLLCEGLSTLGLRLPALFDVNSYTETALWMSIQIVVLAIAVQYKVVFRSIRELTYGQLTAGGVFALYSLILLIYYIVLIITGVRTEIETYNSILLFCALISLVCDVLDSRSIMLSLKVASSPEKKKVLLEADKDRLDEARELVGRYMNGSIPYLVCADGQNITDFKKRWAKRSEKRKLAGLMLIISALFSLILLGLNIGSLGLYPAVKCAVSAFLLVSPIALCFSFSHPVYTQNKKLQSRGATVIGEESFEKYKSPACLIIDDREIFSGRGKVMLSGIEGYLDTKIELALGYAAAIFSKLDCPLGRVFTNAASDYEVSGDVDIAFIADDGIEAAVEGIPVLVGNYGFIKRYGILPEGESNIYENDDCYIYIAIEKQTCLRVQLSYVPSKEFVRSIRALLGKQVNVIIKTCDPNINMRLLERLMDIDSEMPVRILRVKNAQDAEYKVFESCSSGIVTTGDLKTIANAFGSTSKVCGAIRGGIAVSLASALVAAVLIIAISITTGFSGISSVLLLAFQLFWCLPVLVIDKILL